MNKEEFFRQIQIKKYPISIQIMAGRIFDEAFSSGRDEGMKAGIRQGADSALDKLDEAYLMGLMEAQKAYSAICLASMSIALHELHGFAAVRIQRVVDRVGYLMTTTLHPAELAEECAKLGVMIDDADTLREMWEQEEQGCE